MSSENSKPEWFQMTEAEVFPPQSKGKRAIRIMALTTPILVLGAGLVFAQTQGSPTAVASAVTSPTAAAVDPVSIASTPTPSTQVAASTPVTAPASTAIQVSLTSPNPSSTVKKPAIATLPTGGGDDEGVRTSDDD